MFMFQSGKTKTYELGGLPKSSNSGDICINHFIKGPSINLDYALLQCLKTGPNLWNSRQNNWSKLLLKWCNHWISENSMSL